MPSRVSEHTFDYQPVLAEPRADAEQVTELWPGEPFTIEERRDGWARIRTTYDYPGWIPEPASDPIAHARAFLGTPYCWGGMSKAGIDCSGLVHMSFRATGRLVPRDADQQEAAGEPVTEDELRPGDLISYGEPDAAADHIAFWLGEGRILHSTRRDGVNGVLEEQEPDHLRARRRRVFRF